MAGRGEHYAQVLRELDDWTAYLRDESNLPGPRANLELAAAAADVGDTSRFLKLVQYDANVAPTGTADEFLAVCGTVGIGQRIADGETDLWPTLRARASDPRWRVREAVAMGLQRVGDRDMRVLLKAARDWCTGNLLERRAAIAGICEPRLLRAPGAAEEVLDILVGVTASLAAETDRRSEPFRVLRQALGYCWSVAVVADEDEGKKRFEVLAADPDPDVRWIVRENLKKQRLKKMDASWVEHIQNRLRHPVSF